MALFKLWKPKLPFNIKAKIKNPFRRKKTKRLYRIWRRFLAQIPPIFRRTIQSYDNFFIVLGDAQSGKSQLIRKYIEKEQDVYSFETIYTAEPEAQFYLGSKYLVGEIAWPFIEDRSIDTRKELIHLFENLYPQRNPTAVISYNPTYWARQDQERVEQHARLLLNKLSLLTHITNKPIKVRVALTHLDKIEGYIEFVRAMQACGGSMELPLLRYEGETLKESLNSYEQYLTYILKTGSTEDFLKALHFLKKLPSLFATIDQFLRAMMQKGTEKRAIILDKLFFTSSSQSDTTSLFECKQSVSPSVFIRRHLLKHQVAGCSLLLLALTYLIGKHQFEHQSLKSMQQGITQLERYQSQETLSDVLPLLKKLPYKPANDPALLLLPSFFHHSYSLLSKDFIEYSKNYILWPKLRKTLTEGRSEIKTMYLLGLLCSTNKNKLGQLILENREEWSNVLELPIDFIDFHVRLCDTPQRDSKVLENFFNLYLNTSLTSYQPWIHCLDRLKAVIDKPALLESALRELKEEARGLLSELKKLKEHRLTPFICKLLMDEENSEMQRIFSKKVQVFQTLKENSETLHDLLTYIEETTLESPSLCDLNLTSYLTALQDLISFQERENRPYHFFLGERPFSFETTEWDRLVTTHKAKQLIQDYIIHNRESNGRIFFKNVATTFDVNFSYLEEDFPHLKGGERISGFYTVNAYQKFVFSILEKVARINESTLIDFELKNQLNKFIAQEVEVYAREYKRHYQGLFQLFDYTPTSLDEAQALVSRLAEPSSNFIHFLYSLRHNLKIPLGDLLALQPMQHLSEFQFLNLLLADELNKPAEFAKYQEILRELLEELEGREVKKVEGLSPLFDRYLSAPSKVSLAILTNAPDSYQMRVNGWLQENNVPPRYHPFFLNPLSWIYAEGLKSLKSEIEEAWSEEAEALVQPLLSKFPFNPHATEEASLVEVDRLHPDSPFWRAAQALLSKVSVERAGRWEALNPHILNLNPHIYRFVNSLKGIRELLWDAKGERQPILLKVQTVPFKVKPESRRLVVLSYLISGGTSLFNINQTPEWEIFPLFWWKQERSHIGLEVVNAQTKGRGYHDLKEDHLQWSFFHLLRKGELESGEQWRWNVSEITLNEPDEEFRLSFETLPFKLIEPQM